MQDLKVLISAYACKPGKGSDPGIAWDVARTMADYYNVWVVTRSNNREAIEAELANNPVPQLHFVYYALPLGLEWLRQQQWGVQFHYYLWQLGAYLTVRKLHAEVGFNLVHHVTYIKYSSPSFLSLLPIPFIWGPVGGGESAPKSFWQDFSLRGKGYEVLRELARWLGEQDPFVRLTARRSSLAWATTEDTAKRLSKVGATNIQVLSPLGLPKDEIAHLSQCAMYENIPIRFISIGRLLHWKGFHLGLRAFAQANLPETAEYWILGDGPELKRLQKLAEELGIAHQVKFWKRLPRDETLQRLGECLALVHPSLHDSGGLVCLEAMATGRPVICLNLGGPALPVTEETGFRIPADHPEQAVKALAEAMTDLANNSETRAELGQAARERLVNFYSWETKGKLLAQTYEEICEQFVKP